MGSDAFECATVRRTSIERVDNMKENGNRHSRRRLLYLAAVTLLLGLSVLRLTNQSGGEAPGARVGSQGRTQGSENAGALVDEVNLVKQPARSRDVVSTKLSLPEAVELEPFGSLEVQLLFGEAASEVNCIVTLYSLEQRVNGAVRRMVVGQDGIAYFSRLLPGSFEIRTNLTKPRICEVFANENAEVQLDLSGGTIARLRVCDSNGTAIPGATIWASERDSITSNLYVMGRTDVDGRYDILRDETRFYVTASDPYFGFSEMLDALSITDQITDLVLDEQRGAALVIQVHSDSASPIEGARVVCSPLPEPGSVRERPRFTAHTDANGVANFASLPPGSVELTVSAASRVMSAQTRYLMPSSREHINVVMALAQRVEARVVTEAGKAVSNATVFLSDRHARHFDADVRCSAGTDGRFELDILRQDLDFIHVRTSSGATGVLQVSSISDFRAEQEIVVQRDEIVTLAITVGGSNPSGVLSVLAELAGGSESSASMASARTDADGVASINTHGRDVQRLRIIDTTCWKELDCREVRFSAGGTYEVDLEPSAALECELNVTLLPTVELDECANHGFVRYGGGSIERPWLLNADGTLVLQHLPSSQVELWLAAPWGDQLLWEGSMVPGESTALGNISVAPPRIIRLQLLGEPQSYVLVKTDPERGGARSYRASKDLAIGVGPGEVSISVTRPGCLPWKMQVDTSDVTVLELRHECKQIDQK